MLVLPVASRPPASLDWSPDGSRLVTTGDDGLVHVLDLRGGGPVRFDVAAARPSRGTPVPPHALFAPDGRHVVTGDCAGRVLLWDAATGERVRELAGPARGSGVSCLRLAADGRLLAARWNLFLAWDAATWEPRPAPPLGYTFALEPGGNRAALPNGNLLDVRTGEACGRWAERPEWPHTMAWCPGRPAVAAIEASSYVPVYDLGTGGVLATLTWPLRKGPTGVAFTPEGRLLLAVGRENLVRVYDCETWAERAAYAWPGGPWRCVAVSPDGTRAAAGGGDSKRGKVVVWDLE